MNEAPTEHHMFDITTMPKSMDQQMLDALLRIEALLTPAKAPHREELLAREQAAKTAAPVKSKFGRK